MIIDGIPWILCLATDKKEQLLVLVDTRRVESLFRAGIFVGRVKELTRVTEINTKSKEFDWTILVLISVTRVNSLTRPTKIPA